MEIVYGRIKYIGKEGRLRKCEGSNGWVWGETKYRSKKTRKVGLNERIRF